MTDKEYKYSGATPVTMGAAPKIASVVSELIGIPSSVVDLGGGGGALLKAFQEIGTQTIRCFDHPSIKQEDLVIAAENFIRWDMSKSIPKPFNCDLAISTEFAEHVPQHMSDSVVNFLTQSSDIVLFSAAIPNQGGLEHINEQRPAFWRSLFEKRQYCFIDAIRPKIVFDQTIPHWFRQNLYLYVHEDSLHKLNLTPECYSFIPDEYEIVHTRILNRKMGLNEVLKEIKPAIFRAFINRVK